MVKKESVEEIKAEIDEINASLPAHSKPPSLLLRLEELEEKLESLIEEGKGDNDAAA
jgi:hypothetical protein